MYLIDACSTGPGAARPAIEPGTSEARGRREVWPLCARPVPRLCVDSNMRSVFTPALEVYDLIPSRAIDIVSASKTKWPAMRAPDLISACNCNAHGKSFEELSSLSTIPTRTVRTPATPPSIAHASVPPRAAARSA